MHVGRNWQLCTIANSRIKITISTPPKFKILENRLLTLAQYSSDRKNVSVASPDADFRKWRYALMIMVPGYGSRPSPGLGSSLGLVLGLGLGPVSLRFRSPGAGSGPGLWSQLGVFKLGHSHIPSDVCFSDLQPRAPLLVLCAHVPMQFPSGHLISCNRGESHCWLSCRFSMLS